MALEYVNEINVEDYIRLRDEVEWKAIDAEQARIGIENSAYVVSCKENGHTIGVTRLLWDGGSIAYICDVMVSPKYQRRGIGQAMLNQVMTFLNERMQPGWKIMISLVAAKGKESFYEKFGFELRPNDGMGAGMSQWIEK